MLQCSGWVMMGLMFTLLILVHVTACQFFFEVVSGQTEEQFLANTGKRKPSKS